MNVMKYAYTLIGLLCIWIFAVLVIDYNDLLDLPMFVYVAILAVMIGGGHVLATKRFGNPGANDADGKTMLKVFVATILGVVGSVVAALVLTAVIDSDYRAELSAPFITCKRDDSQIKTVNIDKELVVDGGTIIIHSIKSDVPQSAKNPQPYGYTCQKAVLADVTITSNSSGDEALEVRDLNLVTASKPKGITADELNSSSQFTSYAASENLDALRQSNVKESRSLRGWIAFSMNEADSSSMESFVFDKSGQNVSVDLN